MTNFYQAVPSDVTFTSEQLLSCARDGRSVSSIGYGFACSGEAPAPQHGFILRWVNRQGMGNHGDLVLGVDRSAPRALQARASAALTDGEIARAMRQTGCSRKVAAILVRSMRGISYGRERAVQQAAMVLARLAPDTLAAAPPSGGGLGRWLDSLPWKLRAELPGASCPRMDSAVRIARRLIGVDA
jgi:hypothetical protein